MDFPAFRALKHRNCRLLLGGQLVSLVGTWMQTIAQGWLVYRLTHQPLMLGVVSFAGLAPAFFLAPLGGYVVDHWNTRRLAMLTQGGLLLQAGILGILTITGRVTVPAIIALALFMGMVTAFDLPTGRVLVTRTVPKEDLPNAIALVSTIFHGSRILGPSMAGLVVAAAGEGWCFMLNSISYLAALAALWALRLPARKEAHPHGSFLETIAESLRYVHHHRPTQRLFVLMGLVCFLAFPYITLLPAFAKDVLGTDARGLGWVMGAGGIGATVGALVIAHRRDTAGMPKALLLGTFSLGGFLILFSMARSVWLASLLIVPLGAAMVLHMTLNNTLVQLELPDHLRGRVMALHGMVFLGAVPLGSLTAGWLAHQLGVPWTMVLGGAGCSLATLGFTFFNRKEILAHSSRNFAKE